MLSGNSGYKNAAFNDLREINCHCVVCYFAVCGGAVKIFAAPLLILAFVALSVLF